MKKHLSQIKFLSLVITITMLSGCSFFSPVKVQPENNYMIASVPDDVVKVRRKRAILLVMQPDTAPAYNTTAMAYTKQRYQVSYYAMNKWAETPGQMLHPLIAHTLRKTHRFYAVVKPPYVGRYDYVLSSNILKLEQDFTTVPAMVKLKVEVQLLRSASNKVVRTQLFKLKAPILTPPPYGGVLAANRVTKCFLRDLAASIVKKVR